MNHVSFNAKINQIIELGLNRSGQSWNVNDVLKNIKEAQAKNYVVIAHMVNLIYVMLTNMTRDKKGIDYWKVYSDLQKTEGFKDILQSIEVR